MDAVVEWFTQATIIKKRSKVHGRCFSQRKIRAMDHVRSKKISLIENLILYLSLGM